MEILELMKQRHSVRQYKDTAVEKSQRTALNHLVEEINRQEGLHIQIFYDEPKCFDSRMAHYGKFTGVKNYIALVGPKSPGLDETLGYYGEKIVLKLQELGLNSCWVAMTHGKSKAEVKKGEKEICLISFGYGENQGVPHKSKLSFELGPDGKVRASCGMGFYTKLDLGIVKYHFEMGAGRKL